MPRSKCGDVYHAIDAGTGPVRNRASLRAHGFTPMPGSNANTFTPRRLRACRCRLCCPPRRPSLQAHPTFQPTLPNCPQSGT